MTVMYPREWAHFTFDGRFLHGALDAFAIERVDDEDERVGVVEVVAPQRAELLLPAHVPHREHHVLVLHLLHVEACRGSAGTRVGCREDGVRRTRQKEEGGGKTKNALLLSGGFLETSLDLHMHAVAEISLASYLAWAPC